MNHKSFEDYYNCRLTQSRQDKTRPGNEEKLIRYHNDPDGLSILYIHGFGSCRAEGEFVMDRIAEQFKANIYYLRLPGHGTNKEDQAVRNDKEYLETAEEAFLHMHLLGRKIIVAGTSMGGTLATWLASAYPEQVHGLILVSPFYGFFNKKANISTFPGIVSILSALFGPLRVVDRSAAAKASLLPGYENYWYTYQYYRSVRTLALLKKRVIKKEIINRITAPSLLIYFYKNEDKQDFSADTEIMISTFMEFGKAKSPDPRNRSVRITEGAHVMMSRYIKTDHNSVFNAVKDFIDNIIH
jgi:pimeloyl-ACP methyl ester carboxylesterase